MGDLHSIAYSNSLHNSSLGCDVHNLGVFNADMSLFMDSTSPFFSPLDSDLSTGYLQDALSEFTDRSKRRRLLLFADEQPENYSSYPISSYWNSTHCENLSENFSYLTHLTTNINGFSGKSINESLCRIHEDSTMFTEMKTPEEEILASETFDSPSSSQRDSVNTKSMSDEETLYSIPTISPGGGDKRKKRVITRVVYPFAVVKPGGVEGDMTLNDINERILMPPSRPIRHPVGDFACRPIVSPNGPGLSGKAVVALTRIHTHGSGTITIIRTKG